MAHDKSTPNAQLSQTPLGLAEVESILATIDASALLARLQEYRWVGGRWRGRRGYPVSALWRAYVVSFILNLPNTNALIRRLHEDPQLRLLCGFSGALPHRSNFNRFISRLNSHEDLVAGCLTSLTDRLSSTLPGFGEKVAVDSTVVRTHSNPNRRVVSDQEASWTAKNAAGAKEGGKEWRFGFKYHAVVDATYGLPITGFTTTAKRNDSPELPGLLSQAASAYDWFAPRYVMADRGYDSEANHQAVMARGAAPIVAIRVGARSHPKLHNGIYDNDATPTCMGMLAMEYVRTDPEKGHLYRCPPAGCKLKDRKGVLHCQDRLWEKHEYSRLFGPVRRGSREWKDLYGLRQSVERVFKSLKQSRRLEAHCVRGLRKISLHNTMAVLAFQATALARILAGQVEYLRWQVRRVA